MKIEEKTWRVPDSSRGYPTNFDVIYIMTIHYPTGEKIYRKILCDCCSTYFDRGYERLNKTGKECRLLLEHAKMENGTPYIAFKPMGKDDFLLLPIEEDSFFLNLNGDISISKRIKDLLIDISTAKQIEIMEALMEKIAEEKEEHGKSLYQWCI